MLGVMATPKDRGGAGVPDGGQIMGQCADRVVRIPGHAGQCEGTVRWKTRSSAEGQQAARQRMTTDGNGRRLTPAPLPRTGDLVGRHRAILRRPRLLLSVRSQRKVSK